MQFTLPKRDKLKTVGDKIRDDKTKELFKGIVPKGSGHIFHVFGRCLTRKSKKSILWIPVESHKFKICINEFISRTHPKPDKRGIGTEQVRALDDDRPTENTG